MSEATPLAAVGKYSNLQPKSARHYLFCVAWLSVSFALCEACLLVALGLQTAVNKELGEISSGALYVVFAASALVAPAIVHKLGAKWALVAGLSCFCFYVGANISPGWFTLLPGAIVTGFGAAFLWAAQGSYLTRSANMYARLSGLDDRAALGRFNGLFVAVFESSVVSGQAASSLLLRAGVSLTTLFVLSTCLAAFAVLLMCALPPPPSPELLASHAVRTATNASESAALAPGMEDSVITLTARDSNTQSSAGSQERTRLTQQVAASDDSTMAHAESQAELEQTSTLAPVSSSSSARVQLLRAFAIMRNPKMFRMIPSNMAFGFMQSFQNGAFARHLVGDSLGVSSIGFLRCSRVCFVRPLVHLYAAVCQPALAQCWVCLWASFPIASAGRPSCFSASFVTSRLRFSLPLWARVPHLAGQMVSVLSETRR